MPRMQWIGLAAVGLFLTGCVSQEKYNALKLERDQLSSQLAAAQNDLTAAQAERDSLRKQIELGQGGILSKDALLTNLTTQNSELQKQFAELQLKYEDAIRAAARGGSGGPLPQPLADALQAFANANPDLVDFDASRGIVKFKSDVTFASGRAELTAQAQQAVCASRNRTRTRRRCRRRWGRTRS